MTDIVDRITEYLSSGGLFNPELMNHDKVRDLCMDARDEILRLRLLLARHDWQPIVTAPKDRPVIICGGNRGWLEHPFVEVTVAKQQASYEPDKWIWLTIDGDKHSPEYWMELPEPKTGEK